ncbi:MAG: hypothetical protein NC548_35835 [Lachnospiraceae bacterium]|nr:hypothetical protein [Lachnospiraceae bacterium]
MDKKNTQKQKTHAFDIKRIIKLCFKSWKLMGSCVAAMLVLAAAYLYIRKDNVEVLAQLMLPPESANSSMMQYMEMASALSMDGMFGSSTDNEIAVIKSHTVFERTVRELGLNVFYYQKRYPMKWHAAYDDAQLKLTTLPSIPDTIRASLRFDIDPNDDGTFDIVCKYKRRKLAKANKAELPITLETAYGPFTIDKTESFGTMPVAGFRIIFTSYNAAAYSYNEAVNVFAPSKKTDFVDLSINTNDYKFGIKLLNKIIDNYNLVGNRYRDDNSTRTLDFVNKRLESLETELAQAEGNMTSFKKTHDIVEPEIDITTVVGKENTLDAQIFTMQTDLEIIRMAKEFLANPENKYALLPSIPGGGPEMSSYNELIMRRMRLVTSAKENNPVLLKLNEQIDALRENIILSVDRTYENMKARLASMKKENSINEARKGSVPEIQQEYVSLGRDAYMLQQLYVALLKQKEEAELNMMKTSLSMVTVDAPYMVPKPAAMSTKKVLAAAIFLGLCLGLALVYFLKLPKAPFAAAKQIEDESLAPVLGKVACESGAGKGIISSDNAAAEAMRMLRTNVMLALADEKRKAVLVTSVSNAEGSTFIASNLAVSLAKAGYSTALVEANMRSPRFSEIFGKQALANTLSEIVGEGKPFNPENCGIDNLRIVSAGKYSGNPSDLLGSAAMSEFVRKLSADCQYVVIDATHLRGYSDAFTLAEDVDLTLLVAQTGVATPDEMQYANQIYADGRLPRLACVICSEQK